MSWLALALVLAQAAPHEPPAPGRRAAIAGLAGFHTVSRLEFPDLRMRLTATYVFPDRARWSLENYDAATPRVEQFYRLGAAAHRLESGSSSCALEGLGREHVLLQLELRRAVMLHPAGFDWTDAGDGTREAEVFADSCCRREPLGRLRARQQGERLTIEARDHGGELRETLTVEEFQELFGRRFPRVLAATGVNASFRETIERLETRIHYLDLAFTPGDRRKVGAFTRIEERITARDLVPVTYAERELEAGTSWQDAPRRAEALRAELEPSLPPGLAFDPVPTFEISDQGLPLRCLVRLAKAVDPPPEGFIGHRERLGLFLNLASPPEARSLERLREALPEGATGGRAYVRLHEANRIELVLPVLSE